MTITLPEKWARKLFIKWGAKILRALNSDKIPIDKLVCIK